MPYICTHLAFGYALGKRLGVVTEQNLFLFALGCLGPDVYFFDRLPPTPFIPPQKKHGNRLHALDCGDLLAALLCHADADTTPYLYGFLTHMALDSTLHPYVEAHHSGIDHTRFEGDIDACIYAQSKDTTPFDAMLLRCPAVDAVDALLTAVSKDTMQADVSGAYARSAKKFWRALRILRDPNGRKRKCLLPIERLIRKEGLLSAFFLMGARTDETDCLNLAHHAWAAPWDSAHTRSESVPELLANADALAAGWMGRLSRGEYAILVQEVHGRTMAKGVQHG